MFPQSYWRDFNFPLFGYDGFACHHFHIEWSQGSDMDSPLHLVGSFTGIVGTYFTK